MDMSSYYVPTVNEGMANGKKHYFVGVTDNIVLEFEGKKLVKAWDWHYMNRESDAYKKPDDLKWFMTSKQYKDAYGQGLKILNSYLTDPKKFEENYRKKQASAQARWKAHVQEQNKREEENRRKWEALQKEQSKYPYIIDFFENDRHTNWDHANTIINARKIAYAYVRLKSDREAMITQNSASSLSIYRGHAKHATIDGSKEIMWDCLERNPKAVIGKSRAYYILNPDGKLGRRL